MSANHKSILEHVPQARREFLRRLLAGSAFAAPVFATFSIDALTATSAQAQTFANAGFYFPNAVCAQDTGYVGPTIFQAHVALHSDGFGFRFGGVPTGPRVNGEVTLTLGTPRPDLAAIGGFVVMVPGAIVSSVEILRGLTVLARHKTASSNFTITPGDLVTQLVGEPVNPTVVCDLNELADMMASLETSILVQGTLYGSAFSVSGQILPVSGQTLPV
jgi:hypothetical protein